MVRQNWIKCSGPTAVVALARDCYGDPLANVIVEADGAAVSVRHAPHDHEPADTKVIADWLITPGCFIAMGSGEANTLAAVVGEDAVVVRSALTSAVVWEAAVPEQPSCLEFDLHTIAAVFGGKLHLASFHAVGEPTWSPACDATNLHSVVVQWPHVFAIERDGGGLWCSNVHTGVTNTSAIATLRMLSQSHLAAATKHRTHILQKGVNPKAAHRASVDAFQPRRLTVAAVGKLRLHQSALEWVGCASTSRNLVVNRVSLEDATSQKEIKIAQIVLQWPVAHANKFPIFEKTCAHCYTRPAKGSDSPTIHVMFCAQQTTTGAESQLFQTTCGTWHKTFLVSTKNLIREIASTNDPHTLGLAQESGGYAMLKTY